MQHFHNTFFTTHHKTNRKAPAV
ncbi:protein of unknown function [Acidithiobacillus ferrivorans]|uniref:Uncharacterized protein n=1 Tax=Acidithiobacillus ferrivorans TaxID=160808 RepID=A0ABY1MUB3_9PROT|nr:protein of unknown function [Acidithiobacillus ferrivorans]